MTLPNAESDAGVVETFADELDAHVTESMSDPAYVAAVLADHVMSGEPAVLASGKAWIWRCVCGVEQASGVRSGALEAHRIHVATEIATRVNPPGEAGYIGSRVVCEHDPVCHRRPDGWPECSVTPPVRSQS